MVSTDAREAFVERLDFPDPGNAGEFASLLADCSRRGGELLCVLVKTPGNGLTNDYSRTLAIHSITAALAAKGLELPMIIASGGTEGIGIPHLIAFGRRPGGHLAAPPGTDALALGHGVGPAMEPDEIGSERMARATAAAVRAAFADAGIGDPAAADLVIVKAPLPPPGGLALDEAAFAELKSRARGAAALGAAVALGEQDPDAVCAALDAADPYCSRVLVSAATDDARPQALVLGRAPGWSGRLAVGVAIMHDMLDTETAGALLRQLGLSAAPQLGATERGWLRAVLAKGELPRRLRGVALPSSEDSDIHPNRHFRAALGGILGALIGDARIYLSGGSEHQVPPGAVLLAVIAEQA
ncbi:MAG TPA: ring-opening amidohydrolase [Stellaceae bacterium]|nr:ring-opening amidohydrolase [Stellaceae bacterium]